MASSIKKGQEVVVIAGAHKGSRGKVLDIQRKKERVLVEGVNMRKKHERRTQDSEGGIVERETPLHVSNVMAASRYDEKHSAST
ncbi:MAG: 50S ribosomal protein L24 [Puniceicoccaceae bacterium]